MAIISPIGRKYGYEPRALAQRKCLVDLFLSPLVYNGFGWNWFFDVYAISR